MKYSTCGLAFPECDEFMLGELKMDGTYQIAHLEAALKYVKDWRCAVDGGAHVGVWSLRMARSFDRVISAEPSADTFECLERNLLLRNCRNVDARNVALGAEDGFASMTLDAINAERKNTGARHIAAGLDVRIETIDSWRLPELGFLKLDVEGSEPAALEGAADTIARCRPVILYENKWLWTKHFGHPKDAVDKILRRLGYRHIETVVKDAIWVPVR